jgi:hypothetical protein
MGTNEYVVVFVAVVYFLGGYILGRCYNRRPRSRIEIDPDPLAVPEGEELAEVIPLRVARPAGPSEAVESLSALSWVVDHSRMAYRGMGRGRQR